MSASWLAIQFLFIVSHRLNTLAATKGVLFRPRGECNDQLPDKHVDWSRSTCVLQTKSWMLWSTNSQSCRLITINTIDGCSSGQEKIMSINWLSVVSIIHDRYDRRTFFRPRVVVLINWMSIIAIANNLYNRRLSFKPKVDCVDQTIVECFDLSRSMGGPKTKSYCGL